MANPVGAPERVQQKALEVASPEAAAKAHQQQALREKLRSEGQRKLLEDARNNVQTGVEDSRRDATLTDNLVESNKVGPSARTDAERAITSGSEYVRNGYDAMAAGTEKDRMRDQALDRLKNAPWMNEVLTELPSDTDRQQFAEGLLRDERFTRAVNRKLQERVNHRIADTDVQKRVNELKAAGKPHGKAEARMQLEAEWQKSLDNVVGDTVDEYLRESLDRADNHVQNDATQLDAEAKEKERQKNGEDAAKSAEDAARQVETFLNGKENRRENLTNVFDAMVTGGLEPALVAAGIKRVDINRIMKDPTLRAQYESQIGLSVLGKRMREGNRWFGRMTKEDIYRLVDAKWCGQEKLIQMFEQNRELQTFIKQGQARGEIDPSIWDKLRNASRTNIGKILLLLLGVTVGGPAAAGLLGHSVAATAGSLTSNL